MSKIYTNEYRPLTYDCDMMINTKKGRMSHNDTLNVNLDNA